MGSGEDDGANRTWLEWFLTHRWWVGISGLLAVAGLVIATVTLLSGGGNNVSQTNSGNCTFQGSGNTVVCIPAQTPNDNSMYAVPPDGDCLNGIGYTAASMSDQSEQGGLRLRDAAWSIVNTGRDLTPYDYSFKLQFVGKKIDPTDGVISLLTHPDPNFKNTGWDRWYQYVTPIPIPSNGCAAFSANNHDESPDAGMNKDVEIVWLSPEDSQHLTDIEERSKGNGIVKSALPAGMVVLGKFTVKLP